MRQAPSAWPYRGASGHLSAEVGTARQSRSHKRGARPYRTGKAQATGRGARLNEVDESTSAPAASSLSAAGFPAFTSLTAMPHGVA